MDWPVCKLQVCFAQEEKQKVNKHPNYADNFDIWHQSVHFEYEMNRTLMTPLYSSLVASTLKNKIHATFLLRCGTLGSEMFTQGKKQLETRANISDPSV